MSAAPGTAGEAGAFVRYGAVGVIGFAADAGVLQLLWVATGLPPIPARLLSFTVAVLVTFALNRRWTFAGMESGGVVSAFIAYLGIQGVAFVVNFGVYAGLVLWVAAPWNAPVLALAVASAIGLIVNYAGARFVVFGRPRDGRGRGD